MGAFGKEVFRTIARKPGRFLALLAIVALGAGFYAGLRMTAPDMGVALDDYLDEGRVYDVRVVAPLGMDDQDLEALDSLPAVEDVMLAYQVDVLATMNQTSYTTRLHSYPMSAPEWEDDSDEPGYLNRLDLYEGSWPAAEGECLIAGDRVLAEGVELGDTIAVDEVAEGSESSFSLPELTVVGKVHTPAYVSSAAIDSSSLGSGVVQQVIYLPEDSFEEDAAYSDAYLAVAGARQLAYQSEDYDRVIAEAIDQVEGIADERRIARFETLQAQMRERLTTYDGLLAAVGYRLSTSADEREDTEEATWLVMDRSKNAGTASYTADAERVDNIARVFPTVFFIVAALVALTTMTRMVDEERQLIGTYKALGYTRARITGKYLIYAGLASGIGSLVGIAILGIALPFVIMRAYAIIYYAPPGLPALDMRIAFAATVLSVAITIGATWASAAATLREKPAALMLPRVPKSGQRILLERITPFWRRLSFIGKVTCRNIFRYKKRLVMTVIGIAGCTALLVTGLGLRDSISDIIDIQYGQIIHSNAVIAYEEDAREDQVEALDAALARTDLVNSSTKVFSETMLASGPRASDKRIDIVCPSRPEAFYQMKTLRTRLGHEPLTIPSGSALLNEKLAQELGLAEGDVLSIHRQDVMGNARSVEFTVTIGGLYENYLYNYLYVDDQTFKDVFGEEPAMNAVYADVTTDQTDRDDFEDLLKETGCVRTVTFNDETVDTYRTMLRSVDMVVVVLVLSAAALAFIVLYNLTNINIEERIREIATLKVLGFTRREAQAYIFREVVLLALIGCIVGLLLGTPLESFVVTTAEVDQVMFGRTIHPFSYVVCFVLTMVFSGVSMLLMLPKLARIDMVESLKSNE